MSKKKIYFAEAERLYVTEQYTLESIAARLGIAERTVRSWKDEGGWEEKRKQMLEQKEAFHSELYSFARALMASIKNDMENGGKTDAHKMYTFTRILPLFSKVKEYEEEVASENQKQDHDKPKGLSDEAARLIKEVIFGVK